MLKKGDIFAVLAFLVLGFLLISPFLGGRLAYMPIHPARISPFAEHMPADLAEEPHNFNVSDRHQIIAPDLAYTKNEVESGRFPLWNAKNFAGLPHQANPLTGVLYPPNALFALTSVPEGFAWSMVLHVLLGSLFAYLLLRGWKVSPLAAFFGGLSFAISGWMSAHYHHAYFVQGLVWLPLALWAVERILSGPSRIAPVLLAAAVAMMWLGGFPQTVVINGWFLLAWTVFSLLRLRSRCGFAITRRRGLILVAFAGLGLAMAAVQILPTLELAGVSGHQDIDAERLSADALEPVSLLHLVVPDIFGHPAEIAGPIEQENIFCWWLLAHGDVSGLFSNNYSERTFYPGLLVLLLALAAPLLRRDRIVLLLGGATVLAVTLAIKGPQQRLLAAIPSLDFGSPMRLTQIAAFALPMLAGLALDRLLSVMRSRPAALRMILIAGALPVGLIAALTLALAVAPRLCADHLNQYMIDRGVDRLLGVQDLPMEGRVAILRRQVEGAPDLAGPLSRTGVQGTGLRFKFTLLLGFSAGAWLLAALWARGRPGPATLGLLAILLVSLDLGFVGWRSNRPIRADRLWSTPAPGLDFLRAPGNEGRMVRFDPMLTSSLFVPNLPLYFGLEDLQGFRALTPRRFLEFMGTVEKNEFDIGFKNLSSLGAFESPQMDLLGVRWLIARRDIADCPLPRAFPAEGPADPMGMAIYENVDRLPRAVMTHELRIRDAEATLDDFRRLTGTRGPAPFDTTVWLEEEPKGEVRGAPSGAVAAPRLSRDEPGHIDVLVDPGDRGVLVVNEQFAAGWRAVVHRADGTTVEPRVLVADHTLIGVPVEAGATRIELRYDPLSFRLGGLLSGMALVFALISPLFAALAREPETGGPRG